MPEQIYNFSPEEIWKKFATNESGLSAQIAAERLKEYGPNKIEKKQRWRWLKLVLGQFKDPLVWILLVAGMLALVFREYRDVSIIFIIVLLNAVIGFIQEFKAERILDHIQKFTADKAFVVRAGRKIEIDAAQIVPGDIVFVSAGDNVPADGYLVESYKLRTNSFVFTGESRSEAKAAKIVHERNVALADIDNMVFTGEQVATGEARFVVTGTGMKTELGKIADLATGVQDDLTPLQKKMHVLGRDVAILAILIGALVVLAGSYQKLSWYQNFLFALAIAVSVVPEGLPAALSVALSLGMRRLLKVNVLVKKLIAVETLGSVNIICTDKTGTITKNELTVTEIGLVGEKIMVSGVGYIPTGQFSVNNKITNPRDIKNLELLMKIGVLCNDAELAKNEKGYKIVGDPTEGALIVAARKYSSDEKYFTGREKKLDENPFDSSRMRMSVIYQGNLENRESGGIISYVKGSPEVLLGLCSQKIEKNGISTFTDEDKRKIKADYDEMSARALRVLAFAYKDMSGISKEKYAAESEKNLVWTGMMAMIDPPRTDVGKAIEECRASGIQPVMITGDYAITAAAIAENIGLINPKSRKANPVISGKELDGMTDKEIVRRIKNGTSVFARIAPEQKLRIATALKKSGAVIAMTGDGVNDAPALKRADIGVAMGVIGTDVSKEAADMILLDDNFSSIVNGVKEGRTIYQNIKKFVFYVFSSNSSEFFTVVIGMLLQLPAPITAIQILAVDLGTDIFPSLALGVEPVGSDAPTKKPQESNVRLLGGSGFWRLIYLGSIMATGALVAFIWSMKRGGWNFGEGIDMNSMLYVKSTAATYAVLSMTQMANLLQSRSFSQSVFEIGFFRNKYAIGAILISVGMLLTFMHVPFFQRNLHMAPIDSWDWMVVVGTTLAVFFFEEARKAERKREL